MLIVSYSHYVNTHLKPKIPIMKFLIGVLIIIHPIELLTIYFSYI